MPSRNRLERVKNMTEPIVQLQNLSKTIRGKQLIQQLNIDLYPGQITGFLGPNGAGKTTTIRMMTGLMHPTEGNVIIDGLSLKDHYEEAISKVGVIVENPEMYKFMSGYKIYYILRVCIKCNEGTNSGGHSTGWTRKSYP